MNKKKILITTFFIMLLAATTCHEAYAQGGKVKMEQVFNGEALTNVLRQIEERCGTKIVFSYEELATYRVKAKVKAQNAEQALRQALEGLPVTYAVSGKLITVKATKTATDKARQDGAYKVSVNSAALRHPELIEEIARRFGSQVCVCAIDARLDADGWHCYLKGGRERTDRQLLEWAKEAQERGAGEILFTSMNHDGVKNGYANEALRMLADHLSIPVIASGGAGCREHFLDVFTQGHADAALAASVFHFGEIPIPELKAYLKAEGVNVRI